MLRARTAATPAARMQPRKPAAANAIQKGWFSARIELAVRNAAAELTQITEIDLKWPNDLLSHWRKLGGLLLVIAGRLPLLA